MHLALHLSQVGWELEQTARAVFRPHGLSPAQFNVLNLLSDQPAGLKAGELARQMVVDPANVTRLLATMEKKRWLRSAAAPDDGRQRIVCLTPAGQKIWKASSGAYHTALDRLTSRLTEAQVSATQTVLTHIQERCRELRG